MEAHDARPPLHARRARASLTSERARPHDLRRPRARTGRVTSTRSRLRNDLMSALLVLGDDEDGRRLLAPVREQLGRGLRRRRRRTSRRRGAPSVPACAWSHSALRSAALTAFLFTLTSKSRGVGGNATPPPVNCGARIVPWRARPVPFWRHGFARPPETSPRLFAARVPWRRAFISARTASCTRCGLISAPKTASSSETSFFVPPSTGAFGAAISSTSPGPRRCRSSGPARRP